MCIFLYGFRWQQIEERPIADGPRVTVSITVGVRREYARECTDVEPSGGRRRTLCVAIELYLFILCSDFHLDRDAFEVARRVIVAHLAGQDGHKGRDSSLTIG